jgi:hypothetical protein
VFECKWCCKCNVIRVGADYGVWSNDRDWYITVDIKKRSESKCMSCSLVSKILRTACRLKSDLPSKQPLKRRENHKTPTNF